jgi:hypothetical protein
MFDSPLWLFARKATVGMLSFPYPTPAQTAMAIARKVKGTLQKLL